MSNNDFQEKDEHVVPLLQGGISDSLRNHPDVKDPESLF